MSHYFSRTQDEKSSAPRKITYQFEGYDFVFKTDKGVFSKNHIDEATALLLQQVTIKENQTVLDLGCGYGVIGISIAKSHQVKVTLSDVNQRALELTKENIALNFVKANTIESDGFDHISETFDHIITNPPVRIGKEAIYKIFEQAKKHLNKQGYLWLVMHKKHGLLSAIRFLENHYRVQSIKKHKGFQVIRCENY